MEKTYDEGFINGIRVQKLLSLVIVGDVLPLYTITRFGLGETKLISDHGDNLVNETYLFKGNPKALCDFIIDNTEIISKEELDSLGIRVESPYGSWRKWT